MKKYIQHLFFAILILFCAGNLSKAQTIKEYMKPAVKDGGFKMEGYILWCPSVIKVGDTYHMFASRWPEKYGLGGWTTYSEIVRATSDNLYGPYTFQEVVLQKRKNHWDSERAHNPKIVKVGDTYVLYYISTANETGYAYSNSITGPWTRSESVAMPFSNPAPLVRSDGSIYVFGRRSIAEIRIAQGYTAPAYNAEYTLLNEGKNLLPRLNQLEDPTIWWAANQYNVILSDFRGDATGVNKNGAQYYSTDGIHYKLVSSEPVYTKTVSYDDGTSQTFRRRERPFVYVNEKGAVTAFFTACLTEEGQSWIEVQPVKHYIPKKFYKKEKKSPSNAYFQDFPQGASPQEIGNLVAERFLEVPHQNFGRPGMPKRITYPEVCTWYGALTFAKETGDANLTDQLVERFEPLFTTEANLVPLPDHVDHSVFGAVPLELYRQTKEKKYLKMGLRFADKQWGPPEGPRVKPESHDYYDKGLTWQTRMWIDDMYMITAVQAQAYRATGDEKYINRAAKEMVVYLDALQRPNGLFYHAPDVPFFWGRGDGWMAAGMSELLRSLPKDNPNYAPIMRGYKTMMASLLKYQSENGMWRQLIDDPESWPETSGTGMFTFAMITGVKEGWLDAKTYGPAARKGWLGLISYINPNGDIREVSQGTNKKNDRQYYLDRKRIVGDMHGQAPVLWCATALLR